MAGITLSQAQAKLDGWMLAEDSLQNSQTYKMGSRELVRADLAEVRKQIEYWNRKVKELERASRGKGARRRYTVTPM